MSRQRRDEQRRRGGVLRWAGLGLVVLGLLGATPAAGQVTLRLEPEAVVAEGVSPGGWAVFFAVNREPVRYHDRYETVREVVVDEDGDGVVVLEVASGVAFKSVWAVVDGATGEGAVAAPEGFGLRELELVPGRVISGLAGGGEGLQLTRTWVEVLLVRPGVGAWGRRILDGWEADGDGRPSGGVVAALEALEPVAPTSEVAPEHLQGGDVVLLLMPETLEHGVLRLGGDGPPGDGGEEAEQGGGA